MANGKISKISADINEERRIHELIKEPIFCICSAKGLTEKVTGYYSSSQMALRIQPPNPLTCFIVSPLVLGYLQL